MKLTQAELAAKAGIGRNAVSYWETKKRVDRRTYAVVRMASVVGLHDSGTSNARAGGWGVSAMAKLLAAEEARQEARIALWREEQKKLQARRRVYCGAKTRRGTACQNKSEPGKCRCKFHGGMSTGPKTAEGRARIAEAQRKRWAGFRCSSAVAVSADSETGSLSAAIA